MFSFASRSVQSSCAACQKRFSHKLVEIELTQNVTGLGRIGDRLPVSPGRARNVLVPNQQAMYVVAGKAVSPLRDMMKREQTLYGGFIPTTRIPRPLPTLAVHSDPNTTEDPSIAIRQTESALLDALSLLPPLSFSRRLISSSTSPLLSTTADNRIFGSVAEADVLEQMKDYNVILEEGIGAFAETQNGIEKGRVKAVGKYLFTVQLKALEQSVDVVVEVTAEE